jgi:hypothetical protein
LSLREPVDRRDAAKRNVQFPTEVDVTSAARNESTTTLQQSTVRSVSYEQVFADIQPSPGVILLRTELPCHFTLAESPKSCSEVAWSLCVSAVKSPFDDWHIAACRWYNTSKPRDCVAGMPPGGAVFGDQL